MRLRPQARRRIWRTWRLMKRLSSWKSWLGWRWRKCRNRRISMGISHPKWSTTLGTTTKLTGCPMSRRQSREMTRTRKNSPNTPTSVSRLQVCIRLRTTTKTFQFLPSKSSLQLADYADNGSSNNPSHAPARTPPNTTQNCPPTCRHTRAALGDSSSSNKTRYHTFKETPRDNPWTSSTNSPLPSNLIFRSACKTKTTWAHSYHSNLMKFPSTHLTGLWSTCHCNWTKLKQKIWGASLLKRVPFCSKALSF